MSPRAFPRLVAIETTNYCNAKCVFCPNDKLKRGKQHMSDALFEGKMALVPTMLQTWRSSLES